MERLIPVLTQLQSVLGVLGSNNISLPQLIVVGSQSSGKSSVLENIVGRDFLPRGSNIVTRRPLVLTLHTLAQQKSPNNNNSTDSHSNDTSKGTDQLTEYGIFDHLPNQKFSDFSAIKREICDETDRLVGKGQNISAEPIFLHIYSPYVPPLTMVDLPGITKVATGDQPEDIEKQIKNLVLRFITNPNSIIVAVSSATEDIANSEALKMARQIDPQGQRTLGVVTKIDLMDQGTNALNILQNNTIPLKLGYVGVINRSQKDINHGKPIKEALLNEKDYFQNSEVYGPLASFLGTEYLAKRLSTLLFQRLQQHLPVIKQQILQTILETEREFDSYGLPLIQQVFQNSSVGNSGYGAGNDQDLATALENASNITHLGPILLELLSRYAAAFVSSLDGRSMTSSYYDLTTAELYGGARISFVFNEIFGNEIEEIDPFQVLTDCEIRTAMRNATGPRTTLFLPEIAFDLLVKQQIERLRQPSLTCIDLIMQELSRVGVQCQINNVPQLQNFPVLKDAVLDTLNKLFNTCVVPTKNLVRNIVNIELAYINTSHPDFIGGSRALQHLATIKRQKAQNAMLLAKEQGVDTSIEEQHQRILQDDQCNFMNQLNQNSNSNDNNNFTEDLFASNVSVGIDTGSNARFGQYTSDQLKFYNNQPPTEREIMEIEVIKLLIASYFNIVKKTIKDTVPKAIMLMLVNKTKDDIQSELVKDLYKESKFVELLTESPGLAEQRQNCQRVIKLMRKALEIIHKINDTNI